MWDSVKSAGWARGNTDHTYDTEEKWAKVELFGLGSAVLHQN